MTVISFRKTVKNIMDVTLISVRLKKKFPLKKKKVPLLMNGLPVIKKPKENVVIVLELTLTATCGIPVKVS